MLQSEVRVTDRNGRRLAIITVAANTPTNQQLYIGWAKRAAFDQYGSDIYTFVHDAGSPGIGWSSGLTHSNPLASNNRRGTPSSWK